MRVANKLLEFRQAQYEELKAGCGCGKELGDVTTVNMTSLKVRFLVATTTDVPC